MFIDVAYLFEQIVRFAEYIIAKVLDFSWPNISSQIKTFSFFLSVILAYGIVYSFIKIMFIAKKRNLKDLYTWDDAPIEVRVSKWDGVKKRLDSLSPVDWNMAILEADNIMESIMKRIGYEGKGLGERLKQIEPSDFDSLQDVWEAHKVRNRIAHEGVNFKISKEDAERVVALFEKGLKELEYIS